ncbi:hypothetical protein SISNIDRAFT_472071 [Sistotremastrum niveocremeum HHB9708]|uniref:Ceramide glucosyltransferase n=2 Tax=Sistotremastraceae TaxID=3402574 RepID=A0A165AHH3_9AGAM|nr:hypothetical protein SISNIDRAFT_472071 [Sistotremastrum niveocremeum HHB9708]KZT44115.1 hypothetical protein SISSUDRAFT_1057110 [Sistotremastrum suecicum HHB10207 ss-3]
MVNDGIQFLDIAAVVVVVWYFVLWSICLLGWYSARSRYNIRPRSPLATAASDTVPGVSVLRPLKGLDANLFENLESSFVQEYPKFEILLSVADENDQALDVVRRLMEKYPQVKARIIIGDETAGINPKVNNLLKPFREASYDILWVLDSGIQSSPGTLARSVDALNGPVTSSRFKKMGIVHHVPFVRISGPTSAHSLGTRLEEAFLNTTHGKMYIALNALAVESCVVGKSNMYRRSDVELLDGSLRPHDPPERGAPNTGLAAFARFLAEDNMIASALWHELNLQHTLSCDVAYNVLGEMPLSGYLQRRIRWIRVRKHMVLAATLLEPLTESVMLSILASWAFSRLISLPVWLFLLVNYCGWIAVDLNIYSILGGHPLPRDKTLAFLWAWTLRELLTFPIWLVAVVGNEVEWRGTKYRVTHNGEVESTDLVDGKPKTWFSRRSRPNGYQEVAQE